MHLNLKLNLPARLLVPEKAREEALGNCYFLRKRIPVHKTQMLKEERK
jgi:hypothetical protein